MNNPVKGGRGVKAPYETIHYRIPEPIKPSVQSLATVYKHLVIHDHDPSKLLADVDNAISENYYPTDEKMVPSNEDVSKDGTKLDKGVALELLNQYLGEHLDDGLIPIDDKTGKPKARYDQLAKFKAWLESL